VAQVKKAEHVDHGYEGWADVTAGAGRGARTGVQSVDRAVAILRCFDARRPDLGITEIARMTGLSTSTTHRLLVAMQTNRLVRQTSDRRYGLGPLLVQLARSGAVPTTLRDAALPLMHALRDEIDETVAVHELLPGGERAVVDQVESRQVLRRTYTDIGVPLELPLGAPGKAILAVLPVERQEWWLDRPIPAVTPRTITDPERLRAQLAVIRGRGWSESKAERNPGIRAVASPLFDHTGDVVGALGTSVPDVRMDDRRAARLGARVRDVAWQVSETLGATGDAVARALAAARRPDEEPAGGAASWPAAGAGAGRVAG
jgi:IclR family transcriptional regulator, acetate operon repressor